MANSIPPHWQVISGSLDWENKIVNTTAEKHYLLHSELLSLTRFVSGQRDHPRKTHSDCAKVSCHEVAIILWAVVSSGLALTLNPALSPSGV